MGGVVIKKKDIFAAQMIVQRHNINSLNHLQRLFA